MIHRLNQGQECFPRALLAAPGGSGRKEHDLPTRERDLELELELETASCKRLDAARSSGFFRGATAQPLPLQGRRRGTPHQDRSPGSRAVWAGAVSAWVPLCRGRATRRRRPGRFCRLSEPLWADPQAADVFGGRGQHEGRPWVRSGRLLNGRHLQRSQ
ncbi:MAG: hypothetical protein FJ083_07975 [Cyanobacteria bacterium K_Offshore_surface_m2_239]|nr:hypothetical protein [Cyanobacteria bacterium K_Offshore_surface_m2_239]